MPGVSPPARPLPHFCIPSIILIPCSCVAPLYHAGVNSGFPKNPLGLFSFVLPSPLQVAPQLVDAHGPHSLLHVMVLRELSSFLLAKLFFRIFVNSPLFSRDS